MRAWKRKDVDGAFVVVSGPETYDVYLGPDLSLPRCSCAASIYKDAQNCKHVRFIKETQ